jgi:uncharacterized coiled-coil protein SlyX
MILYSLHTNCGVSMADEKKDGFIPKLSDVPKSVLKFSAGVIVVSLAISMAMQNLGLSGAFANIVAGYATTLDQSTKNLKEEINKLSVVVFRIEKLEDRASKQEDRQAKQEVAIGALGSTVVAASNDVADLKKRVGILEGVKIKRPSDTTQVRVLKSVPIATPDPIWKMW